ncbi:Glyoxalase/Bleomycin resistance protein/Dihydroxybiphenyl dioxygenase [Xylariaceae sp. FL0594]|nr:Glyoxalase/Bleomycin resistance protein/Dihydroxybiphenyl dioxygenase [Xylariaceae sp. FL0594]
MLTGLHHINLVVPAGTLSEAAAFYEVTLGLRPRAVPEAQAGTLLWYDIGDSGEQVHIAFGPASDFETAAARSSPRHICFRVPDSETLAKVKARIWEHFTRGGQGAPVHADEPGKRNSGDHGKEYPERFFARDYAGNRLEFSL